MARSAAGRVVFLCLALVGYMQCTDGFYLPGFAPETYEEGARLTVFADKLSSNINKVPYDYFSLPFCQAGKPSLRQQHLNFGEILLGSRDEQTEYEFFMNANEKCKMYCAEEISKKDIAKFKSRIEDNYYVQLNVDNMPSIFRYMFEGNEFYAMGFPLGFKRDDKFFLFNHVSFKILIHRPQLSLSDISNLQMEEANLYRVVGFEAVPRSIDYKPEKTDDGYKLTECGHDKDKSRVQLKGKDAASQFIAFSYDVQFELSDIAWATRWDQLLMANPQYKSIQWFYILNSLAIMLFLSLLVAGIMLRTIYLDFARYNNLDEVEDGEEDNGWKQISGDVFRPPPYRGALAVLCGTGLQVGVMVLVTLSCAHFGFFSPVFRGRLLSALILFWVLTSTICGFVSARLYTMLVGLQKKMVTIGSALFFSGMIFAVFFIVNIILAFAGSSAAVNFFTLVALLLMWLLGSVPLNVVGAFLGYKAKPLELPTRMNAVTRPIPNYTNVPPVVYAIISGVIPFGVVFIELAFVLKSLWQNDVFYMFGFLFIVFCILVVTCAEVSIVLTYLILCKEDWRWWWLSFMASGSSGLYVLVYSLYFIFTHTGLQGMHFSSLFLFGSYSVLSSIVFSVFAGTIGFLSTLALVRKLYAGVHVE